MNKHTEEYLPGIIPPNCSFTGITRGLGLCSFTSIFGMMFIPEKNRSIYENYFKKDLNIKTLNEKTLEVKKNEKGTEIEMKKRVLFNYIYMLGYGLVTEEYGLIAGKRKIRFMDTSKQFIKDFWNYLKYYIKKYGKKDKEKNTAIMDIYNPNKTPRVYINKYPEQLASELLAFHNMFNIPIPFNKYFSIRTNILCNGDNRINLADALKKGVPNISELPIIYFRFGDYYKKYLLEYFIIDNYRFELQSFTLSSHEKTDFGHMILLFKCEGKWYINDIWRYWILPINSDNLKSWKGYKINTKESKFTFTIDKSKNTMLCYTIEKI